MHDAITDVAGIEVGHATDAEALTGCTVVVCRAGATAGVAVRGAAPGTRETDLCRPGTLVRQVHAVALCGGSAFGLEAASGVARHLAGEGVGFDAQGILVPIVPAAVIFDLSLGAPSWPDVEMGRAAAAAASSGDGPRRARSARARARRSARCSAWRTRRRAAWERRAWPRAGSWRAPSSPSTRAATWSTRPRAAPPSPARGDPEGGFADSVAVMRGGGPVPTPFENSTIAVVATDAPLDVEQANHLASVAHDALARAIRPVHTMFDGDTVYALATGDGDAPDPAEATRVAVLAVEALERATVSAVRAATGAGGVPAARDL